MIFILIICVYALDIHFKLPRRDIRCFSDRLQQEEILTGKVISDSSTFSLKIVDSETSKQLHYTFNDNQQEFKIVPTKATSIQFCIHNMDNFVISINLVYETGMQELDYSKEAQMQDFVEIKQYINHLSRDINHLRIEHIDMMQKQDNRNDMMHQISKKVMIFSFLTIIFMIIATLVQTYRAKYILKVKKSI